MLTVPACKKQSAYDLPLSRVMSVTDMHQVLFQWPHTEPTTVIVTGTFDKWAATIHLEKNSTGFEGVIQIPWEQKIKYKFVVDGEWLVHEDQPTEVDPGGFVNNTYTAPAKPIVVPAFETNSLPVDSTEKLMEVNNIRTNGDSLVTEVSQKHIPQSLPKYTQPLTGTTDGQIVGAELKTSYTSGFLSDLANTIAARDGTSSALAYVASGVGAAMHSAVGIDPINIPKIAIPTPKNDDDFTLPPSMGSISPTIMEDRAPELPPSPIAPLVPIMIVPVNAAENNTATSSPPPRSMHILPRDTKDESDAVTVVQENNLAEAEVIHVKSEAPTEKSPEPTLVPSNEVIVPPLPEPTPVDEAKLEGHLSTDSEERTSDKKSVRDAVVETIVKPIVIEDPPVESAVTEGIVEQTPIHVIEPVGVVELPVTEDYPAVDQPSVNTTCLNETTTAPATTVNTEAESVSTSSVIPTVAQVPTPSLVVEDSRVDEPIVAAVVPFTESNLVTEEKAQTPSSVPEIQVATNPSSNKHPTKTIMAGEFAEPSVIAPESHAVNTTAVAEREVAELIPATNGHVPAIPPKATPSTSLLKGVQDFPSSQTHSLSQSADNSSSSGRFDSLRKKRTSIIGKIKHIFHHDKEKGK